MSSSWIITCVLRSLLVLCAFEYLTGFSIAYEYRYNPSAEELDDRKIWTRDFLMNSRRFESERFVPKFLFNKRVDSNLPVGLASPSNTLSYEKNEKVKVDLEMSNDASDSSLSEQSGVKSFPTRVPEVQNSVSEVSSVISDIKNIKNNQSMDNFPIFFTNPVSGIIYAITEVTGIAPHQENADNVPPESANVPIYITKQQYDRDISVLRRKYEASCKNLLKSGTPSAILAASHNPPQFATEKSTNKAPMKLATQLLKTQLTVKEASPQVKRKKKSKNTQRRAIKNLKKRFFSEPVIVFGNKTPSKLDTQVEKPNLSAVFSKQPLVNGDRLVEKWRTIHKISRRSTLNSTNPKKLLSTQIHVTSEYVEPTYTSPKSSVEHDPSKVSPLLPCRNKTTSKKPSRKKHTDTDDDGDDYDLSFGVDDDDDDDDEDYGNASSYDESPDTSDNDEISSLEGVVESGSSADYGALEEDNILRDKKTVRKRTKRRRPSLSDDDYDEGDSTYNGVFGVLQGMFLPIEMIMSNIYDFFGSGEDQQFSSETTTTDDNRLSQYPPYTMYSKGAVGGGGGGDENTDNYKDMGNSFSSWFSSWFGYNRRTRKIPSTTTTAPTAMGSSGQQEPSWFESWFGYDDKITSSSVEDNEDDKWFFGWFDSKPNRAKRTTTTTTSTTQVPFLTISNPMINPQKWIGILAQHIVNSSTTEDPLLKSPTTANPDIPTKVSYDKYQIWRLKPEDGVQVTALEEYKKGEEGARLQWLMGPSLRGLTDVLVPPQMLADLEEKLSLETISHEVLLFDVGKAIFYEQISSLSPATSSSTKPYNNNSNKIKHPPSAMSWNKYHNYDAIVRYLEQIQMRNSQLIELIHIGRSYEGRPLIIVKIESKQQKISTSLADTSSAAASSRKKLKLQKKSGHANAVFIEAGGHGHEWIGPATSTWMISELLRIVKSNKTNHNTEYIKNTTWYIMPVLNPDGYEYSQAYDRMWRKSRSRHISKPSGIINSAMMWLNQKKSEKVCYGVDLDRNWHFQWGRIGSSKSPCNEFYAGPSSFSEPETRALSKFLMDYRKQIKLFISLQSYGQVISYPNEPKGSSFTSQKIDDFLDVAMVGIDGQRKKGSKSRYKINSSNDLVDERTGSSDAFAAYEVGIPFSYTIYSADNGVHGYLLPSTYIEPTAKDTFEIITAMIDYI